MQVGAEHIAEVVWCGYQFAAPNEAPAALRHVAPCAGHSRESAECVTFHVVIRQFAVLVTSADDHVDALAIVQETVNEVADQEGEVY